MLKSQELTNNLFSNIFAILEKFSTFFGTESILKGLPLTSKAASGFCVQVYWYLIEENILDMMTGATARHDMVTEATARHDMATGATARHDMVTGATARHDMVTGVHEEVT